MTEDEVVREVRAAREAFAASRGYDIRAMVAALHRWGVASGRDLVRAPPAGEPTPAAHRPVDAAATETPPLARTAPEPVDRCK